MMEAWEVAQGGLVSDSTVKDVSKHREVLVFYFLIILSDRSYTAFLLLPTKLLIFLLCGTY